MNMTRRSAVRVAAWTTPAVVIATTAPAFANSPTDPKCPEVKASGALVVKKSKTEKVKVAYKDKKGKTKYRYENKTSYWFFITPWLVKGKDPKDFFKNVRVLVDGIPAMNKGLHFESEKGANPKPLIQIADLCGNVVWSGKVGRDC